MKKTLWQRWTEPKPKAQNGESFKADVGDKLTVTDLTDYVFVVDKVLRTERTIDGEPFAFTDYETVAKLREDGLENLREQYGDTVEGRTVRIRFNQAAGGGQHVLVLELSDEMAYDRGLHDVVLDDTGVFEVELDGVVDRYWRVHDVLGTYVATTADQATGRSYDINYWDYWRNDDRGVLEFLIVELEPGSEPESGYFRIWKGRQYHPDAISRCTT